MKVQQLVQEQAHRPWPIPKKPWIMRQSWCDLLFAHWPIAAKKIRRYVPEPLKIQEFEGSAWIGIVPFHMKNVRPRFLPSVPWLSHFAELNVRIYVEYNGKPGVWFFSLDANRRIAVWAARTFFNLPYFNARMHIENRDERLQYHSKRADGITFDAAYSPTGPSKLSREGSLVHWLTERYCLYAAAPGGRLYRTEVHHQPWPLQPAKATISQNELISPYTFDLSQKPPVLHFAKQVDVLIWWPERII